eukprot:gene17807-biopygen12914
MAGMTFAWDHYTFPATLSAHGAGAATGRCFSEQQVVEFCATNPSPRAFSGAQVMSVPAQVMSVPAQVMSIPAQVISVPAQIMSVPAQVMSVPAQVMSVPAQVMSKQASKQAGKHRRRQVMMSRCRAAPQTPARLRRSGKGGGYHVRGRRGEIPRTPVPHDGLSKGTNADSGVNEGCQVTARTACLYRLLNFPKDNMQVWRAGVVHKNRSPLLWRWLRTNARPDCTCVRQLTVPASARMWRSGAHAESVPPPPIRASGIVQSNPMVMAVAVA